jgi:hypothetical protein
MSLEPVSVAEIERRLRPISGLEEELVVGQRGGNAAALCNELLARCMVPPGGDPGPARDVVGDLVVPQRDLALVALRRRSLGDRIKVELTCGACESAHEVGIDLDRVQAGDQCPRAVEVAADGRHVTVRLPTARDQERVLAEAGADLGARRRRLVADAVESVDGAPAIPEALATLGEEVWRTVEAAVEAALPDVDLELTATCPSCAASIEAPVLLADLVLGELRERGRSLLREVHALASTYHWSERDILALEIPRRHSYLALIEAEQDAALIAGALEP